MPLVGVVQTHVNGSFYACWFADYVLQVDGENVSAPIHKHLFLLDLIATA